MKTKQTPFPFLPNKFGPNTYWVPVFLDFLKHVTIVSKEDGPVKFEPYEAQYRFLNELCKGLDDDVRHFVCLKARQLGMSTLLLALDLFWLFMHDGLQGALITDDGANMEVMRETIRQMLENLPPRHRIPVKKHNRTQLVLANGSRLQFMVAGTQKNRSSGLGVSRGLNFVHATECSRWGNQESLDTLVRSLAQKHPDRLYMFESTARGFNVFFDMCKEAKEDPGQHYCFIGWWAKEIYRISAEDDPRGCAHWWGRNPHLTDEEAHKVALVKEKYGHEIDSEQIAFYRRESFNKSPQAMSAEMPWDDSEAFVATGSAFFSLKRVTQDMELLRGGGVKFDGYAYRLGKLFTDTRIERVERAQDAHLRIWEDPRREARYVIGVDVAEGKSEHGDNSIVSVWRCFSDKLIQVAEYATPQPETRQLAWVVAHLAGCYRDCVVNLEMNGPGPQVMHEIAHLKQQIAQGNMQAAAAKLNITDALANMRWYLYQRADVVGGSGYVYNTQTTQKTKVSLMNGFRDNYNAELALVRSVPLLDEMRTVVQDGDKIAASGRNKDDRVIGGVLAVDAWAKWVRPAMIANGRTFVREMAAQKQSDEAKDEGDHVMHGFVERFLTQKQDERRQAYIQRLIDGF